MWTAVLGFLARLLRPLAAPIAAYLKGRADAANRTKRKALEDEKERVEKGRQAVRDADGRPPDEQLRRNDRRWSD